LKLYPQLVETISTLRIVDTHEHLELEEVRTSGKRDLFDLFFHHYSSTDVVSAGMPLADLAKMHDLSISMEDKWKIVKPYWRLTSLTNMGRTLMRVARDVYGVDDINDKTIPELLAAFREMNKPGLYEKLIRQKGKILVCIQDSGPRIDDSRYFVNIDRLDRFIGVRCMEDLKALKDYGGWDINTIDDLERAMEQYFNTAVKRPVVGIKCALAYYQPLDFPKATKQQAETDLEQIKQTSFPPEMLPMVPHGKENRYLTNYMIRKALKLVEQSGLPFVIHTGYLEGLGNFLSNANPEKLTPLFREFPNVRFVLYHAGYPFWREAGILAKTYKNVYLDMCFIHVLSEHVYRVLLSEYLELLVPNKLFAFGADYKTVECTYVQQAVVRRAVMEVMQEKIDRGFYNLDEACFVAQRILRDNAVEFYGINKAE